MEELYYENPYQKTFTAEIINITEKDSKFHVELDNSYFYPESPEQPSDTGFIDLIPVTSVYKEADKLYHVVEIKPLKIHKVKCSIAWEKRYAYMQQHLCQHILSACFLEQFNANTLSSHLGNKSFFIDIDKLMGSDELKKVEEMANKIISDNISIETLYPSKVELRKLSIKKFNINSTDRIRLIRIGDIVVSQCSALHLNSTIEVQLIKVLKYEKHKTGTRIEFVCGPSAVSDYISKHEVMERMSKLLHCDSEALLDKVEGITTELNKALAEKSSLKVAVAEYEVQNFLQSCEVVNNIRILKSIYDSSDLKYLRLLASKLVSFNNVVVLFGIKSEGNAHLIFMCSKGLKIISMDLLIKDAITLIDGKGGGSDFSAQGAGKNNNNLDSCIEYAYNKIKTSLINK